MQLTDVLCYMVLTITVTASCVRAEEHKSEIEESQSGRKISKRDAKILLDDYPVDRIFQKPKVIYRRISKQRYGPPKSKYGPPKQKYRPPKVNRKPNNGPKKSHSKPKKPTSPKHRPHGSNLSNKKRIPKGEPRYSPFKSGTKNKPAFGHVVKMPYYSYVVHNKPGFGEPPMPNLSEYHHPKQSHGEPPVDFFGAPLKTDIKEVFSTPQSFQETSQHFNFRDISAEDYKYWNQQRQSINPDMTFKHTRKQPTAASNNPVYVTPTTINYVRASLDSDVSEKQLMQDNKFFYRKKRPFYFSDSKAVNRPWTANKNDDFDNEIVVGGKYAEPPARYVAKFPPPSPMYEDNEDEDTFNPLHGYVDTDVTFSANNSPYSNYKHSNMAFSPQNLNDAFSIVDKK